MNPLQPSLRNKKVFFQATFLGELPTSPMETSTMSTLAWAWLRNRKRNLILMNG